ncbi:MAG: 50S ribosomal protein L23 [Candidatus Altiarchaeota archaeon]
MNPYKTLLYPLMGEKATTLRERENKLTFIVERKANRSQIKEAVETLYSVKVVSINTMITTEGKKKAHVRLSEKDSAEEVASNFGVL